MIIYLIPLYVMTATGHNALSPPPLTQLLPSHSFTITTIETAITSTMTITFRPHRCDISWHGTVGKCWTVFFAHAILVTPTQHHPTLHKTSEPRPVFQVTQLYGSFVSPSDLGTAAIHSRLVGLHYTQRCGRGNSYNSRMLERISKEVKHSLSLTSSALFHPLTPSV